MWSAQTIREIRGEAGERAREEGLTPQPVEEALAYNKQTGRWNFPFLGDYVPEGWELNKNIVPLFVDATGRGEEGEAALTLKEFTKRVEQFAKARDHFALAILEEGPFQVVVGIFQPAKGDFTHTGKLTKRELRQVRGG